MHRLLPVLILAAACSAPPETAEPPAETTDPVLPDLPPILAQNAFLYYSDLAEAEAFYRDTLGLPLASDFGFAKIFQVAESAYLTLVDEAEGMHSADEPKTVAFALITERLADWQAGSTRRARTSGAVSIRKRPIRRRRITASRCSIRAVTSWSSSVSCPTPRTWT